MCDKNNLVMDFTSKEKHAIVAVLASIMKADGVINDQEKQFMEEVFRKIGININDFQQISTLDIDDCKQIIGGMTEEKKAMVSKCFLDMVGIDGHVDLRELRVLHNLL